MKSAKSIVKLIIKKKNIVNYYNFNFHYNLHSISDTNIILY